MFALSFGIKISKSVFLEFFLLGASPSLKIDSGVNFFHLCQFPATCHGLRQQDGDTSTWLWTASWLRYPLNKSKLALPKWRAKFQASSRNLQRRYSKPPTSYIRQQGRVLVRDWLPIPGCSWVPDQSRHWESLAPVCGSAMRSSVAPALRHEAPLSLSRKGPLVTDPAQRNPITRFRTILGKYLGRPVDFRPRSKKLVPTLHRADAAAMNPSPKHLPWLLATIWQLCAVTIARVLRGEAWNLNPWLKLEIRFLLVQRLQLEVRLGS